MHDGGLLTQAAGLSGSADICCLCNAALQLSKRMLFDQLLEQIQPELAPRSPSTSLLPPRCVMHRIDRGECQKRVAFGRGRDSALLMSSAPQSKANGGAVTLGVYLMGTMAVDAYVTCATGPSTSPERSTMGCKAGASADTTVSGTRWQPGQRCPRLANSLSNREGKKMWSSTKAEKAVRSPPRLCTRCRARWARAMVVEARCHTASNGAVPLRPRLQKMLPWRSMSEARCVAAT